MVDVLTGRHELVGAAAHFETLRDDVLRCGNGQLLPSRYHDRLFSISADADVQTSLQHEMFVHGLATWATSSRRVFRLSNTMQSSFDAISPGNLRLSDVTFPFPAFCVEFSTPLKGEGGIEFPLALVATNVEKIVPAELAQKRQLLFIMLFARQVLETYTRINPMRKDHALQMIRRGDKFKLSRQLKKIVAEWPYLEREYYPVVPQLLVGLDDSRLIADYLGMGQDVASLPSPDYDPLTQALHYVFNMCLYLDALKSDTAEDRHEWETLHRNPVTLSDKVVTDGSRLCEVNSVHLLNQLMGVSNGQSEQVKGYELRPHWRRGHTRRRPGMGNDPNAQKEVRVKPTLVRGDRLPENALPEGSATEIGQ